MNLCEAGLFIYTFLDMFICGEVCFEWRYVASINKCNHERCGHGQSNLTLVLQSDLSISHYPNDLNKQHQWPANNLKNITRMPFVVITTSWPHSANKNFLCTFAYNVIISCHVCNFRFPLGWKHAIMCCYITAKEVGVQYQLLKYHLVKVYY